MGKIRIKDIAEIANVSIGTVDRVIHNRGEVSLATRERIQEHFSTDRMAMETDRLLKELIA